MKRLASVVFVTSIIEWVIAWLFGWVYLVAYVSHLSQLTFTISLVPWIQGLRVEARQVEEDIPREVTEHLVQSTNLRRVSNDDE